MKNPFKYLSAWLHRAYGKPPYILLDEYDTPLHSAHVDNYYDQMIAFIRSFMVQTFKDNPHLKQAVLIGNTENRPGEHLQRFQQPQSKLIAGLRKLKTHSGSQNQRWKPWPLTLAWRIPWMV